MYKRQILNHKSIFECVDYFKSEGFNDNSFVIGPVYKPYHYNCLNLPDNILNDVVAILLQKKEEVTGYLKNSYENLIQYYTTTEWQKNIRSFYYNMGRLDHRREQESRQIFKNLYEELDANALE